MSVEAPAWSEAGSEADDGAVDAAVAARRAARPAPRRPDARASERKASWNVLAEEILSFPRPGRHATLEELTGVGPRGAAARTNGKDAARARSYGEAWLERELRTVRYLADSGYPAMERASERGGLQGLRAGSRPAGSKARHAVVTATPASRRSRVVAGRYVTDGSSALFAVPLEDRELAEPQRPRRMGAEAPDVAGRTGEAGVARPLRHATAIKPRGLRRLLPGVVTLAALAGVWAGAGAMSASHAPRLDVLPGSVKAPGGYLYVVRPGDTLWSIASRLEPGGDPRALVAQLEVQVPGGSLVPGRRLVLP